MTRFRSRWLLVAVAVIALGALITACGESGSSSSGGSSTGGGEGGSNSSAQIKAAAEKLAAKAEKAPEQVPEATPLKNTNIPKGKTVAWLSCGVTQCEEYYPYVQEGAEALGWTSKMFQGSVEPNKMVKALEEVVRYKPDVFLATSITPSLAAPYFKEMQDNGTIIVMCCTAKPHTESVTKLVSVPEDKLTAGKAVADSALAEDGEDLHAVWLESKDFEVVEQYREGFINEIERLCPNCSKIESIDVAAEEIGKPTIATTVVSYLRAHPETNYIGVFYAPLALGVPAAMEAAGINDVSLGTTAIAENSAEGVKEEKEGWKAAQNFGVEWGLWGLNIAVRTMLNEPLNEETLTPEQLVTAKNAAEALPEPGNNPVIKNALEQYEELWGLK